MTTRRLWSWVGPLTALALGSLACGSGGSSSTTGDSGAGGSDSGAGGSGASGSGSDAGPSGQGGAFSSGISSGTKSGGQGGIDACAGESQVAKLVPLDMYVMFDSSGSMDGKTGTGQSKWDATRTAMKNFMAAQSSAGLGIGLEFFPLNKPGVPESCNGTNQCGAGGPCIIGACVFESNAVGYIVGCESNANCQTGDFCTPLGQCTKNPDYYCQSPGVGNCTDSNGNDLGKCGPITNSICSNATSCDAGEYESPRVEIATLPGAAGAIGAALDGKNPTGNTPTAPALEGAIAHAKAWALKNPTHKTVVVLATDGFPTACDPLEPQAIASYAQAAAQGDPSVLTFVIGVFSPEEATAAEQNLDVIAKAGGTNEAFVIDASQDVTAAFTAALDAIRGESLACEYLIPSPPEGEKLDYGKVNVKYTPDGGSPQTVLNVADASQCDPATGGWYYDVDPAKGEPTKIVVCPATCTQFQAGGSVDIELGCKTEVAVPK